MSILRAFHSVKEKPSRDWLIVTGLYEVSAGNSKPSYLSSLNPFNLHLLGLRCLMWRKRRCHRSTFWTFQSPPFRCSSSMWNSKANVGQISEAGGPWIASLTCLQSSLDHMKCAACSCPHHLRNDIPLLRLVRFHSAVNGLVSDTSMYLKVLYAVFIAKLLVQWKSISEHLPNLPLTFFPIHQGNN